MSATWLLALAALFGVAYVYFMPSGSWVTSGSDDGDAGLSDASACDEDDDCKITYFRGMLDGSNDDFTPL
ncbi:hypothetical protein [Ottowia sp.]|uniref:hypothetical protein n=1 Tax=Ottowia sp. TaxID=1898956 RepID=UPI0025DD7353|nr:hypothetical protein [Ottowia sp.]MBK6616144.1 hypothetical protein [Ottowia sp.]